MTCEQAKSMLGALVFSDKLPSNAKNLNEHLVQCPDCQRELDAMQKTAELLKQGLNALPEQALDDARVEALLAAAAKSATTTPSRPFFVKWTRLMEVAAILILITILAGIILPSLQSTKQDNTVSSSDRDETPTLQIAKLREAETEPAPELRRTTPAAPAPAITATAGNRRKRIQSADKESMAPQALAEPTMAASDRSGARLFTLRGDGLSLASARLNKAKSQMDTSIVTTRDDPISTFAWSLGTNASSYTQTKNAILHHHTLPKPHTVRTEEFINAFTYIYPQPTEQSLTLHAAAGPSPFNNERTLLKIGFISGACNAIVQVQFNPGRVRRYRLLGYEKHAIADELFQRHTLEIMPEAGNGQSVTVMFELELNDISIPEVRLPQIGTVAVRYRSPGRSHISTLTSTLHNAMVRTRTPHLDPYFYLAACSAEFAEYLRKSNHATDNPLPRIEILLGRVAAALPNNPQIRDLQKLVRQAEILTRVQPDSPSH